MNISNSYLESILEKIDEIDQLLKDKDLEIERQKNIISDLCAGLVGGLGMAPGANVGDEAAIFEAVHGSAPDIAGQGIANPFALILAAAMMLDQMDMADKAERIRKGINQVVAEGDRLTRDLGGNASTEEITDALIERL